MLHLGHRLGAGVAGADGYHGEPLAPLVRVVAAVGKLELAQDVIAQVDGFGEGLETMCVLRGPGDIERRVAPPGASTSRS